MPERAPAEFDDYRDSYRGAVEDSIAFVSADLDFFTAAKPRTLLDLAAARVGSPDRLSFLDVGCGTGETDRFLTGRVGRLAGVDVSAGMLDRARAANPGVDYRLSGKGKGLPFADGAFDVSFAVCVLHHVPLGDRRPFVAEMARVCRPGGLVSIFEHNPFNPLTRRAVASCEFDRDAALLRRREAAGLLLNGGLSDPLDRYIVFFTRTSPLLRRIERRLGRIPLGAQYVVAAQRPRGAGVQALGGRD